MLQAGEGKHLEHPVGDGEPFIHLAIGAPEPHGGGVGGWGGGGGGGGGGTPAVRPQGKALSSRRKIDKRKAGSNMSRAGACLCMHLSTASPIAAH